MNKFCDVEANNIDNSIFFEVRKNNSKKCLAIFPIPFSHNNLFISNTQKNKENKNKKNQLLYLKFFARFFLNNLPKNTIKKTLNGHNLKKKNILYDELVQGFKILMR